MPSRTRATKRVFSRFKALEVCFCALEIPEANSSLEGELIDLIEDFSDGRVQFAFVKVKDANTGLPKNALIAWCGEGVPERTKGYFTSHLTAVAKLLHVRVPSTACKQKTNMIRVITSR